MPTPETDATTPRDSAPKGLANALKAPAGSAIIWWILFGVLSLAFLSFGLTSLILTFFSPDMDTGVFTALSQLSAFSFFVFLFFGQIITLVFFGWLIFWVACKAAAYFWMQRHDGYDPQVPKLFSVVAASIVVTAFFSSAIRAIFDAVLAASAYLFGTLPQVVLGEIDRIIGCVSRETEGVRLDGTTPVIDGAPIRNCIGELVREEQVLVNDAVYSLTTSGGIGSSLAPQILLALVVFAAILRIVDAQVRTATTVMKFWTAYSVIAAVAIYLSLSATLSVSLLLEKKQPSAALTGDALVTQIMESYGEKPNYDFSALGRTQSLSIVGDETHIAILVNSQQVDAVTAKEQVEDMLNDRDNVFAAITNQARTLYGLVERDDFNSREQALYFQDLLLWSQAGFASYLNKIYACNIAYRAKLNAFRLGGAVYDSLRSGNRADPTPVVAEQMSIFDREVRVSNRLLDECLNSSTAVEPPDQRELGSSLGPIGQATGWLLRAQSLPLTLVVGLVGYGLLGALISRFVIARDEGFRIDSAIEFAVVALAGFVAALVVFVSSFGGMYILAREATEPNPYAVFALCLGGAIFSSQVWTNLRDRLGDAAQQTEDAVAAEAEEG